jgi:glycosyltransferase involved in cell wall biosynthesis
MKVLWFSHIPVFPKEIGTIDYKGGTWITTLLKALSENASIELAVCFHSTIRTEEKINIKGVTYYNIQDGNLVFKMAYRKIFHILTHQDHNAYLEIIDDFKPDVIQVFGTESGFGNIIRQTEVPVIIHMQGLINPILLSWFPPGINLLDTFLSTPLKSLLFGNGFFHKFIYLKKQAERELEIISSNIHFFSRTDWDKSYLSFFNPNAKIFHCDEMIRNEFSDNEWLSPGLAGQFIFVSILNDDLYKGWDNILKTANILRRYSKLKFEWRIIGANPGNSVIRMFERKANTRFAESNVVFKGKMDATEIVEELMRAHLFIHLSHIDNSPNSVCEAMLLGMPVLCSDVGGCSSLITDNLNGFLIHDNDPFYLGKKICDILMNTEKTLLIAGKARKDAMARHNSGRIIEQILNAYEELSKPR